MHMKEIGRLTGVDFDSVLLTELGRRSIRDGAPVVIVPDQQSEEDQEDHLEGQQKPRKHQLLQLRERHAATHARSTPKHKNSISNKYGAYSSF